MLYLMVFLGGGLGSICRYGLAVLFRSWEGVYPVATFAANLISCLILGWLIGLSLKQTYSAPFRLFFLTGFCGGFSTFSTFSMEIFFLLRDGNQFEAFAYIVASLLAGVFFIFLGLRLA